MTRDAKNSKTQSYHGGGLAELVSSPTVLTYSFLSTWFTGQGSVGSAMKLLGLPYTEVSQPIIEQVNGDLLVNLSVEEETLYKKTLFTYKSQENIHQIPQLSIAFSKLFDLWCIRNTVRIILIQSKWIAFPETSVRLANKFVSSIATETKNKDIATIDLILQEQVWPFVIAVGFLSEFYHQLVVKETKGRGGEVQRYIAQQIAVNDWFFNSIAQQEKVKNHRISFSEYIKTYGLRADKDYELTMPRWYEMPDMVKKRISQYVDSGHGQQHSSINVSPKLQKIIDTSVQLQLLRSEAKHKSLVLIDALRKAVQEKSGHMSDIRFLTKEELLQDTIVGKKVLVPQPIRHKKTIKIQKNITEGKGIPVAQGEAEGIAVHIQGTRKTISHGTIGIFSNASPEFAIQYPQCSGIIFLQGGQTSHGAIVAREFGIPALIDPKAAGIQEGAKIQINGATGIWSRISAV